MSSSTSSTGGVAPLPPPDWYPDPADALRQRWWDGSRWSQSTRQPPPPVAPAPGTSPAHQRLDRLRDEHAQATETADGRELASLWTRGAAFLFDFVVASALGDLAGFLLIRFTSFGPDALEFQRLNRPSAPLEQQQAFALAHPGIYLVFLAPSAVMLVYFLLSYVILGATPGQLVHRIRPVPVAGGRRIGLGAALARGLWFGLLSPPLPILPIIGGLRAQADPRRQGWHDKLAGTQVITTRTDEDDDQETSAPASRQP